MSEKEKKGEKPSDKLGIFITKYILPASRTFRHSTGMPAYYGYLRLEQISTDVVLGTVKEEDLKRVVLGLSFANLARLKELLKDFDGRLNTWKTPESLDKRRRL